MSALAYVFFYYKENAAKGTLLLVCTLSFDEIMYFLLINLGNFESELICLERCEAFMKLEPERGYVTYIKGRA
jgi:hypothetical protein